MRHFLVAALVLLGGCGDTARAERSTDALIIVFADGFHSGIILERSETPPALLPPESSTPWVVVHFGERRWITGEADGCWDAIRLGVASGEGGVQVDCVPWWIHTRGGTDPREQRVWVFPVSAAQVTGLRARLDSWNTPGGSRHDIRPGTCWWPSSKPWELTGNCHDFTVDLLAGAGIHVDRPLIMVAGPLRAALDRAWSRWDKEP